MSLSLYSQEHRHGSQLLALLTSAKTSSRIIKSKEASKLRAEEGISANFSCLDGGTLFVAENELPDFIRAYHQDFVDKVPWYLSEMVIQSHTTSFRLFLEIDFEFQSREHLETLKSAINADAFCRGDFIWTMMDSLAHVVSISMHEAWKKTMEFCLEICTGTETKTDNSYGLHVRSLNVCVNVAEMRQIATILVKHLAVVLPCQRYGLKGHWDEFIDCNPYKNKGGMRLPFSYKCKNCPDCNQTGKKRQSRSEDYCNTCNNRLKVHVDRTYVPCYIFSYLPLSRKPTVNYQDLTQRTRQCIAPKSLLMDQLVPTNENEYGLHKMLLFPLFYMDNEKRTGQISEFDHIVTGFDNPTVTTVTPSTSLSYGEMWTVMKGEINEDGEYVSTCIEPILRERCEYGNVSVRKVQVKFFDGKIPYLHSYSNYTKQLGIQDKMDTYYTCTRRVFDHSGYLRLRVTCEGTGENYCHTRNVVKANDADSGPFHKNTVIFFETILPIGEASRLTDRVIWYWKKILSCMHKDTFHGVFVQGCMKFSCNSKRSSKKACFITFNTRQMKNVWEPFIQCYMTKSGYVWNANRNKFLKCASRSESGPDSGEYSHEFVDKLVNSVRISCGRPEAVHSRTRACTIADDDLLDILFRAQLL